MALYKIFPAIGIARIGASGDFFVGPEIPGQGPIEADTGAPVTRFKASNPEKDKIRKQAARFHLFQSADGLNWVPANLPEGAVVEWTVTLENKKAAVKRKGAPPKSPERPQIDPLLEPLRIRAPETSISGKNATSTLMVGTIKNAVGDGAFSKDVVLGQLRTDAQGRLLVLGGNGEVGTTGPALTDSFYRNRGWYDDVSDGPVTARITLPGAAPIDAEGGAWVVIAPPDFAPGIGGVVTLYDVIRQVGYDSGMPRPTGPIPYLLEIAPLIQRAHRLRFVHDNANWQDAAFNSNNLASGLPEHRQARHDVGERIRDTESILVGYIPSNPPGPPFKLRQWQIDMLVAWVDWNPGSIETTTQPITTITPEGLTRAALEGAVGQGFCPGIEAGIIVTDATLFSIPFDFRIDQAKADAGELTALMAQPWPSDFYQCNSEWWPSQRPDIAPQSADFVNNQESWARGAESEALLAQNFQMLGFIVQQGANEVFIEAERNPNLA
ncbi:hypothetical protein GR211_33445 [Rhizobium leguminosarum]|uniref:LodA/GoxA family CTQ-dependent oxidase n=1 Tax=Rhizobium ruizarguesonis TaxID=2081791 RepID=UPI0013BCA100|nr:LodA/GoxA family CTQ-dependent oxidase [Rhizobium ruizarguesonis]NEJ17754.1 hypothetical protein [Rhizobium ruizarguesonis]NEK31732.1 hypothetical protein [Rhizobium ruizarguesonis]